MNHPDPAARLTERQRECLRLVLHRRNSKEIARELGISSHTVDARLRAAIGALGVASRFEAARWLAMQERSYQPLIYQPVELSDRAGIAEVGGLATDSVQEEQPAFTLAAPGNGAADAPIRCRLGSRQIAYVGILAGGCGILVIAMIVVSTLVHAISTGRPITIHL